MMRIGIDVGGTNTDAVMIEAGQVRHATAPGRQGMAAFNEIVRWKGGTISEVAGAGGFNRTRHFECSHAH